MFCPIINNSNTIELTVHTSCYLSLRLTLCYMANFAKINGTTSMPISFCYCFVTKIEPFICPVRLELACFLIKQFFIS